MLQIALVGPQASGKSSLVNRILSRYPIDVITKPDSIQTYANFAVRDLQIRNKRYKIDLCDTHGPPQNFLLQYRSAAAILLVFDLTSRDSFREISAIFNTIKALMAEKKHYVLIGNKCDLALDRMVEPIEIKKFVLEHDLPYIETSAYSGENIKKLLEYIVGL